MLSKSDSLRLVYSQFATLSAAPWTRLIAGAVMLLSVGSTPSVAQNFPSQPVKLVVPFAAGGGVDVVARIIAPKLSQELGQPVVIENRGGAGGMIGAAAVATSTPDGYTLLLGTGSTHGTNSSVYSKVSYDPVRDFQPIVLVGETPLLLVTSTSLPAKSLTEFIALARSKPGKFSFGSYGIGSINHLGAELFNSMAKVEANHVPYRGSAPALTDLIGGRLEYTFDGPSALGYVKSGTIRLLGIASADRSPELPDVPTISEMGLPGLDVNIWYGLFAPAGTPKPIVDFLNSKANAALASPEVKEGFRRSAIKVAGGAPDALATRVQTEMRKWVDIVREKNIRIEN